MRSREILQRAAAWLQHVESWNDKPARQPWENPPEGRPWLAAGGPRPCAATTAAASPRPHPLIWLQQDPKERTGDWERLGSDTKKDMFFDNATIHHDTHHTSRSAPAPSRSTSLPANTLFSKCNSTATEFYSSFVSAVLWPLADVHWSRFAQQSCPRSEQASVLRARSLFCPAVLPPPFRLGFAMRAKLGLKASSC